MAVVMMTAVPVEMQVALWICMAIGVGLALHENGWLHYLRSKLVVGAAVAILVALLATRTVQASYYDTAIYCAWAWWDWFC